MPPCRQYAVRQPPISADPSGSKKLANTLKAKDQYCSKPIDDLNRTRDIAARFQSILAEKGILPDPSLFAVVSVTLVDQCPPKNVKGSHQMPNLTISMSRMERYISYPEQTDSGSTYSIPNLHHSHVLAKKRSAADQGRKLNALWSSLEAATESAVKRKRT